MKRLLIIISALLVILMVALSAVADETMDELEQAYRSQREGKFDAAIDSYSRLLKGRALTTGQRAVVYLLRGESYKDKGECDRAIRDFDRAMKLKFDYAQAYFFRGVCLEKVGRLDEAVKDLAKAVELNPDRELYAAQLARVRTVLEKQELDKPKTDDKPSEPKPKETKVDTPETVGHETQPAVPKPASP